MGVVITADEGRGRDNAGNYRWVGGEGGQVYRLLWGGGRQLIGSQRTQVWRAGVPTLSMGRRRLHAEQPPPPHSSRQRPVASSSSYA